MAGVRVGQCVCFTLSILLIAFAGILLIFWPSIFRSFVKDDLALTNVSRSYDKWIETPLPMFLEIYMFNWTNYEQYKMNKKIKPSFEELGPYVFSEKHFRTNITWNKNDTVTFLQKRTWHFMPGMSNGTLDDEILNVNVITATVAYSMRRKLNLIKRAVDFLLRERGELLTTRKTVRQLLFDGYDDKFIDMMHDLNVTGFQIPYDKFGWFYPRNNSITYDGTFNMFTGTDKLLKLGVLNSWNYVNKTNFYNSYCGMVNGTTGELWPPIGKSKKVTMFVPDLCRAVTLDYSEKFEKLGLVGRKYVGTDRLIDNGTKYPETGCFSNGEILPSGVLNVSLCRLNAPAFISYPHFYLADSSYSSKIAGMHPNATKHEFYIALEPNTGIPLEVRAQMQINIMIQEYKGISIFDGIPRTFVPMLWFKQAAYITESLADEAKLVTLIPALGNYTFCGIGAIGLLILLVSIYLSVRGPWARKKDYLLETQGEQEENKTEE